MLSIKLALYKYCTATTTGQSEKVGGACNATSQNKRRSIALEVKINDFQRGMFLYQGLKMIVLQLPLLQLQETIQI